MITSIYIYIH